MKTVTQKIKRKPVVIDREDRIYKKYRSQAIKKGSELLFRHADALRFISDCERLRLTILGIDFYQETGDSIIPLLNSADYSALSQEPDAVRQSVAAARKLVKHAFPDGATLASFVVEE
jgi:hypothetical protein